MTDGCSDIINGIMQGSAGKMPTNFRKQMKVVMQG